MRKLIYCGLAIAFISLGCTMPALAKTTKASQTHHVIHATARPLKAVARVGQAIGVFSFDVFDATVIDPFGVALQVFADGLDMNVAAPLEALPQPFETVGDGVHYLYVGIDAVGTQLAK